jgi:hypothetical protein
MPISAVYCRLISDSWPSIYGESYIVNGFVEELHDEACTHQRNDLDDIRLNCY